MIHEVRIADHFQVTAEEIHIEHWTPIQWGDQVYHVYNVLAVGKWWDIWINTKDQIAKIIPA